MISNSSLLLSAFSYKPFT
ncbi:hypothetical protein D046_8659, partial [Vibrio parahaemolyticus V-223/04]